jgi:hypothetical protein
MLTLVFQKHGGTVSPGYSGVTYILGVYSQVPSAVTMSDILQLTLTNHPVKIYGGSILGKRAN